MLAIIAISKSFQAVKHKTWLADFPETPTQTKKKTPENYFPILDLWLDAALHNHTKICKQPKTLIQTIMRKKAVCLLRKGLSYLPKLGVTVGVSLGGWTERAG